MLTPLGAEVRYPGDTPESKFHAARGIHIQEPDRRPTHCLRAVYVSGPRGEVIVPAVFAPLELKRETSAPVSGSMPVIWGPLYPLHRSQASATPAGSSDPPCCFGTMCSTWNATNGVAPWRCPLALSPKNGGNIRTHCPPGRERGPGQHSQTGLEPRPLRPLIRLPLSHFIPVRATFHLPLPGNPGEPVTHRENIANP